VELLEQVRACLLNARLAGSFYLRREGSAVRLDLRRKESAAASSTRSGVETSASPRPTSAAC
jgi:hypothetical protein